MIIDRKVSTFCYDFRTIVFSLRFKKIERVFVMYRVIHSLSGGCLNFHAFDTLTFNIRRRERKLALLYLFIRLKSFC